MFDWTTRLGDTLIKGTETVDVSRCLTGKKYVAFYFSAHFCGPCRKFTPFLSVLYEDQPEPRLTEIVFVSQDRGEKDFDDYFETMPWYAIPYGSDKIEKLTEECGVAGIPHLSVFNVETGECVNANAREFVTKNKTLNFD